MRNGGAIDAERVGGRIACAALATTGSGLHIAIAKVRCEHVPCAESPATGGTDTILLLLGKLAARIHGAHLPRLALLRREAIVLERRNGATDGAHLAHKRDGLECERKDDNDVAGGRGELRQRIPQLPGAIA